MMPPLLVSKQTRSLVSTAGSSSESPSPPSSPDPPSFGRLPYDRLVMTNYASQRSIRSNRHGHGVLPRAESGGAESSDSSGRKSSSHHRPPRASRSSSAPSRRYSDSSIVSNASHGSQNNQSTMKPKVKNASYNGRLGNYDSDDRSETSLSTVTSNNTANSHTSGSSKTTTTYTGMELLKVKIRKCGGNTRHPKLLILYVQLGNEAFRSSDYVKAMEYYKQAIQCDKLAYDNDARKKSNGRSFSLRDKKANDQHQREQNRLLGDAYANLGTVYWTTGQYENAIYMLQNALATYEFDHHARYRVNKSHSGNSMPQIASIYHQLGLAYSLCDNYTTALECLEYAKTLRESLGDALSVAKTFDTIGRILFLQEQRQGPKEASPVDGDENERTGNGDTTARSRLDEALLQHQQALSILNIYKTSEGAGDVQKNLLSTLANMIKIYIYREEWNGAIEYYKEILHIQKNHLAASQASFGRVSPELFSLSSMSSPPAFQAQYKAVHDTLLQMSHCYQKLGLDPFANHCRQEAALLAEEGGFLRDL